MKTRSAFLFFFLISILNQRVSAQNTVVYNCILRSNAQTDTMYDGTILPVYGITQMLSSPAIIPAPVLYCNEGDSLVIDAKSISQGDHHTVHLHGMDVDTRNDGDPMTSFYLSHMQDTTYSLRAMHAGTYIYHCHVADVVHGQMGMYGLVIVRAANGVNTAWTGGPTFSKEYAWLTSEVDSAWHYNPPIEDHTNDTLHVPPYKPDYFLINGKSDWELGVNTKIHITGSVNEKIFLRLANIGYLNNRIVFPPELNTQIIASDGRPLPLPWFSDTVYLMPGERFDVMLTPAMEMSGNIAVEYVNMNTQSIENTQFPQVDIVGYYGVKESNSGSWNVYPNPANESLMLEFGSPLRNGRMSVINMKGQVVLQQYALSSSRQNLNLTGLNQGLYIMRVETDTDVFMCRFIKQ